MHFVINEDSDDITTFPPFEVTKNMDKDSYRKQAIQRWRQKQLDRLSRLHVPGTSNVINMSHLLPMDPNSNQPSMRTSVPFLENQSLSIRNNRSQRVIRYRSKKSQRDSLLHSISLESHQPFLLRPPNVHSILPTNSNDTEASMNMPFIFAPLEPSSIAYNKEDHLTLEPDISQMHCMHETEQIEAENASCSRFVTYPIESGMPHPVNPATLLFASSNMVHSIVNAPSELLATKNPVAANNRRQRSVILKHKRCQEKKTSKSSPAKPQLPLPSIVAIPAVDTVQSKSIQYESTGACLNPYFN